MERLETHKRNSLRCQFNSLRRADVSPERPKYLEWDRGTQDKLIVSR